MEYHNHKGYKIPIDLIAKTGGGFETWDGISRNHMRMYERFCPISPDHQLLELGCGVGRDAIPLTKKLSSEGSYLGIDIMQDCIQWCRENITSRNPNFHFTFCDIQSKDYNPDGHLQTSDYILPAIDSSVDRILLQSVFTHLLEEEIVHYLNEFHRVLKSGGLIFASCFYLDKETRILMKNSKYQFPHSLGAGFFIEDPMNPRRVVGFSDEALVRILDQTNTHLSHGVHRGYWTGRKGSFHFQDILIIGKGKGL